MHHTLSLPPPHEEEPVSIDGIPLLTLCHQLPRLSGDGRFNRYYDACRESFLAACRRELLTELRSAYERSLEHAAPLPQWRAQLIATVTRQEGALISLRTDAILTGAQERCHIRRGDTWDLRGQLPLPLSLFFPAATDLRRRLCAAAAEEITRQEAAGLARYHPRWQTLLRRSFHPHRFFLGEEGLHFFFPLGAIADAVEDIPTFCLPYDEETGPFSRERG